MINSLKTDRPVMKSRTENRLSLDPEIDPGAYSELVDRLMYIVRRTCGTQRAFAEKIGINPTHFSKQLNGKAKITAFLINKIVDRFGVSFDWLCGGEGVPFADDSTRASLRKGVPVYDIDVTAGNYDLEQMFTVEEITGYVNLPRLNRDSIIVHVSGDSMEPEISDGTYIAIRPETDVSSILYGQIYVIVTEDFRRVKYLRRCPGDPDKVILHSANPNYDDIEINKSEILKLFRVEAILNCKICG